MLTARVAKVLLDHGFTSAYGASAAKLRLDVAVRNEVNAGRLPGRAFAQDRWRSPLPAAWETKVSCTIRAPARHSSSTGRRRCARQYDCSAAGVATTSNSTYPATPLLSEHAGGLYAHVARGDPRGGRDSAQLRAPGECFHARSIASVQNCLPRRRRPSSITANTATRRRSTCWRRRRVASSSLPR